MTRANGQKTAISISADGDVGEMKKTETPSKDDEVAGMRSAMKNPSLKTFVFLVISGGRYVFPISYGSALSRFSSPFGLWPNSG